MPTTLGTRFPSTFKGRPPGISEEDHLIWQVWSPSILHKVNWMYFNVRLGEGIKVPPSEDEAMNRMWTAVTQKRADAVLDLGNEIWIVELRDEATLASIGRLMAYGLLWNRDPVLKGKVVLVLVTNQIDRDVEQTAKQAGIIYVVVDIPGRKQPEEPV